MYPTSGAWSSIHRRGVGARLRLINVPHRLRNIIRKLYISGAQESTRKWGILWVSIYTYYHPQVSLHASWVCTQYMLSVWEFIDFTSVATRSSRGRSLLPSLMRTCSTTMRSKEASISIRFKSYMNTTVRRSGAWFPSTPRLYQPEIQLTEFGLNRQPSCEDQSPRDPRE